MFETGAWQRVGLSFAQLLRRYRLEAGLTQEELAQRAGVSARGLSDLERGTRRAPRPDTVLQLAAALRLAESERTLLLAARRPGRVANEDTGPIRTNLPAELTSFIGRERELDELTRLLSTSRLLTLTGPGGIGKTRLALRVAAASLDRFSNGVWLVRLETLTDPNLIPGAIASMLHIGDQPGRSHLDILSDAIGSRPLLLVLDNCEHLIEACAELAQALLQVCPRLHILATSREPVRVAGEQLWPVAPLTVSRSGRSDGADTSDAVRLFAERAWLVQPDFVLDDRNAAYVTEVCRRLDGIPLAIELAAARLRILGIEGLAARLDERLQLLRSESRGVPARQQTLRAAIDWSYDLLNEEEQASLRRLSVFVGGWTATAADAIRGSTKVRPTHMVDLLDRLVDKSLVHVEPALDGAVRYGLLETMRAYALDQLRASGEVAAVRRRHAQHYLELAEEAELELTGPRPEKVLNRLEQDLDNCRAALESSFDAADPWDALRLAAALAPFWLMTGRYAEGRTWVSRSLRLACANTPTPLRARLLLADANLALFQGDAVAAQPSAEAALELTRRLGPEIDVARSLVVLGDLAQTRRDFGAGRRYLDEAVAVSRNAGATIVLVDALHYLSGDALAAGNYHRARTLVSECLAIAQQAGYRRGVARALWGLGSISYIEHDARAARRQLEASLAAARELGDRWVTAQAATWLAHLEADEGHHAAAASLLGQTLELGKQLGDAHTLCAFLEGAAHLAAASGQAERAPRLAGAAAAHREAKESFLFPVLVSLVDQWLAPARSALGVRRAKAATAEGRALSFDQALAEAAALVNSVATR